MIKKQIPVIRFLFNHDHHTLNDLLNARVNLDVDDFHDSHALSLHLSNYPVALVFAYLRTKEDFAQIVTFLKRDRSLLKKTFVKFVVLNESDDKAFEKSLEKLGVVDIIKSKTDKKSFGFKISLWLKSLRYHLRQEEGERLLKSDGTDFAGNEKVINNKTWTWKPALDIEEDIWFLKNESDCKRFLSKWNIKLAGPGPLVAYWNELSSGLWRFEIKKSERDLFTPNGGYWYFKGKNHPEFIWRENTWLFTGDNFNLYFMGNEEVHSRLSTRKGNLIVAKNSLYAKSNKILVDKTFDFEFFFKLGAKKFKDLQGEASTDVINFKKMSGEINPNDLNLDELLGVPLNEYDKGKLLDLLKSKYQASLEQSHDASSDTYNDDLDGPSDVDHLETYFFHKESQNDKVSDSPPDSELEEISNEDTGKELKFNNVNRFPGLDKNLKERKGERFLNEILLEGSIDSTLHFNNESFDFDLHKFFNDVVIVEVFTEKIKVDTPVKMDISFNFMKNHIDLKVNGEVVGIDNTNKKNTFVKIKLGKEDLRAFSRFILLYTDTQKSIKRLVKKTG